MVVVVVVGRRRGSRGGRGRGWPRSWMVLVVAGCGDRCRGTLDVVGVVVEVVVVSGRGRGRGWSRSWMIEVVMVVVDWSWQAWSWWWWWWAFGDRVISYIYLITFSRIVFVSILFRFLLFLG